APCRARYRSEVATKPDAWLFTENETNAERVFGVPNATPHVKDAFHEYVVHGNAAAVSPTPAGTKSAPLYVLDVPAGGEVVVDCRLTAEGGAAKPFGPQF